MGNYNINYISEKFLNLDRGLFRSIYKDIDFFENVDGVLTEELAYNLLIAARENKVIEKQLHSIFLFSDKQTISDRVFNLITKMTNSGTQKSVLVALAHCDISFYQMYYIAQQKICFEAFAWILQSYLLYSCFSDLDVEQLILQNVDYLKCIDWDAYLESSKYPPSKKRIIERYAKAGNSFT